MLPPTIEQITEQIASRNHGEFAAIRARHAHDYAAKYLDLERWIRINAERAASIGLDTGSSRRVLDLGCGAGYFLYVCQKLGHEVYGIDSPARGPMFTELTTLLNVPVIESDIQALTPLALPAGSRFDAITAHMITFNRHCQPTVWDVAEWTFLLDDIDAHLAPGGVICLELNREPTTHQCYTPALRDLFATRGGEITAGAPYRPVSDGHRIVFRR